MQDIIPFNFNSQAVRTTTDPSGQVWFVAQDVCTCLEISNTSDAVSRLDDDEKLVSVLPIAGQNRELLTVNESGLYSLIFTSRKPSAKAFKKWVTSEVLPSIRKTGSYGEITPEMRSIIEHIAQDAAMRVIRGSTPQITNRCHLDDSQKEHVRNFVGGKQLVCLIDILTDAGQSGHDMPLHSVSAYLRTLGYYRKKMRLHGTPRWVWINSALEVCRHA